MPPVVTANQTVSISAKGSKHRLDPGTGRTTCGLAFEAPYPACNRADPICKKCTRGVR
jgi:hypothetical protein